jgi:hypothetical protein
LGRLCPLLPATPWPADIRSSGGPAFLRFFPLCVRAADIEIHCQATASVLRSAFNRSPEQLRVSAASAEPERAVFATQGAPCAILPLATDPKQFCIAYGVAKKSVP